MSRRSLFNRIGAWLEDVAAGGKLDREPKGAGEPWPPAPRPLEEPADPTRAAAWRSLLAVAERLKHFEGCAASKIEAQPCRTADMRWCGREVARCAQALLSREERAAMGRIEVIEAARSVMTRPPEPAKEQPPPPGPAGFEPVRIEVEGKTWSVYRSTGEPPQLGSWLSPGEFDALTALRAAMVEQMGPSTGKATGRVDGVPVVFTSVGSMGVRQGVVTFAARWTDWQAPRCGKADDKGRACTLATGHKHPDDHSGKPRPYAAGENKKPSIWSNMASGPPISPATFSLCQQAVKAGSRTETRALLDAAKNAAEIEAERLRAKEAAGHVAWMRENAASVVLPEHPAVALLRRIEWVLLSITTFGAPPGSKVSMCPCCEAYPDDGHAAGCALAAILASSKPGDVRAEAERLYAVWMRAHGIAGDVSGIGDEQAGAWLAVATASGRGTIGKRALADLLAEERAKGAAEEREACAKVAEWPLQLGATSFRPKTPQEIVILIRARGQS